MARRLTGDEPIDAAQMLRAAGMQDFGLDRQEEPGFCMLHVLFPVSAQRMLAVSVAAAVSLAIAWTYGWAQSYARNEPRRDYWTGPLPRQSGEGGTVPLGLRIPGIRHRSYLLNGVPSEYEGAQSTIASTNSAVAAGREIYAERCAACHGKYGLGVDDAAQSLLPPPALLAFMIQKPIAVDAYLLWSISEGGRQFDTSMPAFKGSLSREEIWRIVVYMRAGFPDAAKDPTTRKPE